MEIPPILNDAVGWIESHSTTVDLIKWVMIGLLAWFLGAFRFLRAKFKRPRLEIELFSSRCIWEELGVVDGNDHNARVVFLINAGINNPTTDPIVVRDFTLRVRRLKGRFVKNPVLNAASLPSRVRQTVGNVTKMHKNWFSHFAEGSDSLTLSARIDSRDCQSGFLLFVSASWGYYRPLVKNDAVPVELYARLTTGERLVARAAIPIMNDHAVLEAMVPGVIEYVRHRNTWNIMREEV